MVKNSKKPDRKLTIRMKNEDWEKLNHLCKRFDVSQNRMLVGLVRNQWRMQEEEIEKSSLLASSR